MKIVFAADGSKCTKKALAFLVTHEGLLGEQGELIVLNVQVKLPPHVRRALGAAAVSEYASDEADKVLVPVKRFLDRHPVRYRAASVVGSPAEEIVKAAKREEAHLIVMGTHGLGLVGRALMGSVAQRVITDCDVPVLLVK
ncbi:MAG: universal stress protein [Rhizobacter sp.]|jgi:nucleotide-binding universal stress UspA family protein